MEPTQEHTTSVPAEACHVSEVGGFPTPLANGKAESPYSQANRRGWRWGLGAGFALSGMYAITLSLLNGPAFAWDTFSALWYLMTPLVAGFALQMGLFAYSRHLARAGVSPHSSSVVATGGTSAVSMVACCAHHLADVLPFAGVAGASLFLARYQNLFLMLGLASNAVAITYLLGTMGRHHLYDPAGSVLGRLLKYPLHKAVPVVAGLSVVFFGIAIYLEVWA